MAQTQRGIPTGARKNPATGKLFRDRQGNIKIFASNTRSGMKGKTGARSQTQGRTTRSQTNKRTTMRGGTRGT